MVLGFQVFEASISLFSDCATVELHLTEILSLWKALSASQAAFLEELDHSQVLDLIRKCSS